MNRRTPSDSAGRHDIAFLAINASFSHSNLASWYLREIAEGTGWRWSDIAITLKEDPHSALEKVVEIAPRILAATFYVFNRSAVLSFVRRYKAMRPRCLVIGGGPEFLGDNREFLVREPCVDVVVRGEGELAFGDWLKSPDDREGWARIPGLCFLRNGKCVDGGSAVEISDLGLLPSPYLKRAAAFNKPFVQLETSRGCSNTCAFCTSGRAGNVRFKPLTAVKRELDAISRMSTAGVRLVDRTFNERPARTAGLIRDFRDGYPDLRFHLEFDPARVTRSELTELSKAPAGRFHVEAGVQSLQPEVYRCVGRQATVKRTLAGLEALCGLRNIDVHADLIAGLPGADLAGLLRDIETLVSLAPAEIQLELLKVLPGTEIDGKRVQYGVVASPEPPYEVLKTREMSFRDINLARELSRLIDWYYNAASLRESACVANKEIPGFWLGLHTWIGRKMKFSVCPSLEARFKCLDAYFEDQPSLCRHRLRYAWMKWGLSPLHGICNATPWGGPIPAGAVLIEGDATATFSRKYCAELDRRYILAYGNEGGDRRATAIFGVD